MKGTPFFYDGRWDEEGKGWEEKSDAEKREWNIWNTLLWIVVVGVPIVASFICVRLP